MNNKLIVIGDLHLKLALSYSEHIEGGRDKEKQEIIDFIVEQAKDCSSVVLLGDQLNSRTNPPEVIRGLVEFIERFVGKDVYIIKGNHESLPNGKSAIDFLKEIKNDKWHIITDEIGQFKIGNFTASFLPYFTNAELEESSNKKASEKLLKELTKADILFHHHTMSTKGRIAGLKLSEEQMSELVLPTEKLTEKYSLIFAGHIHSPSAGKNVFVSGSIFTNEVGESLKYVWKIDTSAKDVEAMINSVEQIKLPGRHIIKIENPKIEDLKFPESSIIKVIITEKMPLEKIDELKKTLADKFDAYIFIERIPKERKKIHLDKDANMLEFSIPELMTVYAKTRKVDIKLLNHGFDIIKL